MNTPISGASSTYSSLAQVGVSVQQDGSLSVNTQTLDQALSTDPNGTAQLFGPLLPRHQRPDRAGAVPPGYRFGSGYPTGLRASGFG